jgi:hypothetical protein
MIACDVVWLELILLAIIACTDHPAGESLLKDWRPAAICCGSRLLPQGCSQTDIIIFA